MLPVLAHFDDVTAELVAQDGGGQIAAVGNALVVAALNGCLVRRHAQAVGHNTDTDAVGADIGQLKLVQPQVHLAMNSYCFGIHTFSS